MTSLPAPPEANSFTRMPWWRRWFGRRSERAGARFLRNLGYRILASNVSDRAGEIDLLALDGKTLVVVEVRSSESKDFETLLLSVDRRKQQRITDATLRFLQHRKLLGQIQVRFDVLAILWAPGSREPEYRHIRHAFEAVGRFQLFS